MKRFIAAFAVLLMSCIPLTTLPQSGNAFDAASCGDIDAYIAQQMQWGRLPGLALGILAADGSFYLQGYGFTDEEEQVTGSTVFGIGSVSKVFAALAARQLIQAGVLDEYAPIQDYLPGFSPTFQGETVTITVQQLLTHKSGIAKIDGGAPYLYGADTTLEQLAGEETHITLVRQPGTGYEYSNLNYLLLARVLEKAANTKYEAYVQENVLKPLKMDHTYFHAEEIPQAKREQGYTILYGLPLRLSYPAPGAQAAAGGGGLFSTAEDMLHLLSCYLKDGVYEDRTLLQMPNGAGYDIYWFPQTDGGTEHFHDGSMPDYTASIRIDRQTGYAVVVLVNANDQEQFFAPGISAGTISQGIMAYLKTGACPQQSAPKGAYERLAFPVAVLLALVYYASMSIRRIGSKASQKGFPVRDLILDGVLPILALFLIPVYNRSNWGWLLAYHPELNSTILGIVGVLLLTCLIKAFVYVSRKSKF